MSNRLGKKSIAHIVLPPGPKTEMPFPIAASVHGHAQAIIVIGSVAGSSTPTS
jgi:hypothetical protein